MILINGRKLRDDILADIKKEVTIVGVSNRIELWSRTAWQDFYTFLSNSDYSITPKIKFAGRLSCC